MNASENLLAAAVGGLLCLSTSACGSSSSDATGDTPQPATTCSDQRPDPHVVQKTTVDESEDDFKSACAARNGIFEIQPGCGGSNACRGMSYDSDAHTLIEHTCRATNTCAGYSCVVCD